MAITLLEAMSHKKPVIASDIPANREALGDDGIWCKYEDSEGLSRIMKYTEDISDNLELVAEKNYTHE